MCVLLSGGWFLQCGALTHEATALPLAGLGSSLSPGVRAHPYEWGSQML